MVRKALVATTFLFACIVSCNLVSAQSGGGGAGGSSGGGTVGASPGASPAAGSAGAGPQGINGIPSGPANAAGPNNSGNDPSGVGNSSRLPAAPGTNSLGTAKSSGSPASAPSGTVGRAGAGSANGRIDGTTTNGPALPGDDTIRTENSPDSKVDQKIKSICKGC